MIVDAIIIPNARAPADASASNPSAKDLSIFPLMISAIVLYIKPPGTKHIVALITNNVTGVFSFLDISSAYKEKTTAVNNRDMK